MEIANSVEADAGVIAFGWLWRHESGTYVKFTAAGAEMFCLMAPKGLEAPSFDDTIPLSGVRTV